MDTTLLAMGFRGPSMGRHASTLIAVFLATTLDGADRSAEMGRAWHRGKAKRSTCGQTLLQAIGLNWSQSVVPLHKWTEAAYSPRIYLSSNYLIVFGGTLT
jgi:pectin methylesterase-like acyl-CoA thioesterase